MTDRHSGYIVVLSKDIRDDDAEAIINAIQMIKGIQAVTPIVADAHTAIAESRIRMELAEKLRGVIRELWENA